MKLLLKTTFPKELLKYVWKWILLIKGKKQVYFPQCQYPALVVVAAVYVVVVVNGVETEES